MSCPNAAGNADKYTSNVIKRLDLVTQIDIEALGTQMAADGDQPKSELGQIALAVRIGQPKAEAALMRKLEKALRLICKVRRIPESEADDLIQESLLTVLRQLRGGHAVEFDKISAYVEAVFTNIRIAGGRKMAHRSELVDKYGETLVPAAIPTPDQAAETEKRAALVREAVGTLTKARDRSLLREHYLEEQSKSELCNKYQLSLRQFDKVIYRARIRLMRKLEDQDQGLSADECH